MNKIVVLREKIWHEMGVDETCDGCRCEMRLVLTEDGLEAEITCECGSYSTLVA